MNIRQRLLEYIDYKGISKYKFYQDIGLSNGFLDKNSSIGSDKCEKIINYYSDLSLEWLILGKGPMIKNDHIHDQKIASEPVSEYKKQTDQYKYLKDLLQEKDKRIDELHETIQILKEQIDLLKSNYAKTKA